MYVKTFTLNKVIHCHYDFKEWYYGLFSLGNRALENNFPHSCANQSFYNRNIIIPIMLMKMKLFIVSNLKVTNNYNCSVEYKFVI